MSKSSAGNYTMFTMQLFSILFSIALMEQTLSERLHTAL